MKINRRDFIKTGGMVMLGSLAVPSFLGSCTGNKVDQATGISFAQNHFGVSESDMKKVLAAALEKGGDYADLFFEHSYRNNIGLQDGAVNRASSNIDFGMGVRVLAGDQTGYAYVENVTLDEMLKAARTVAGGCGVCDVGYWKKSYLVMEKCTSPGGCRMAADVLYCNHKVQYRKGIGAFHGNR